jgi:hypothetical protein
MTRFKKYSILYTFHDSRAGFTHSIDVIGLNVDEAIEKAKNQVSKSFGSNLLTRFTFTPDPTRCGIVI